jgi:hypothetical protein
MIKTLITDRQWQDQRGQAIDLHERVKVHCKVGNLLHSHRRFWQYNLMVSYSTSPAQIHHSGAFALW